MSKQVNCVNIEPEILHGNWSSYWKYNKVLTLSVLLCISVLYTIHYNAGHSYKINTGADEFVA